MSVYLVPAWIIAMVNFLYNMAGFMTGYTYDYRYRSKTYCGSKALFWFAALVAMYYIPYKKWGLT